MPFDGYRDDIRQGIIYRKHRGGL